MKQSRKRVLLPPPPQATLCQPSVRPLTPPEQTGRGAVRVGGDNQSLLFLLRRVSRPRADGALMTLITSWIMSTEEEEEEEEETTLTQQPLLVSVFRFVSSSGNDERATIKSTLWIIYTKYIYNKIENIFIYIYIYRKYIYIYIEYIYIVYMSLGECLHVTR